MAATGAYALLLAAGGGARFGGPKLLAPLRGRPLVAHVAATLAEAIDRGILAGGVAVIPSGDTALAWHLDAAGLRLVENRDASSGIASSVRLGLGALEKAREPPAGAALIVLADQPLLSVQAIRRLVAEWRARGLSIRPRYASAPGEPGHPVLLDRSRWTLARELTGDRGLGSLLRAAPDPIVELDLPGENPDVDTPDDLSALEDRHA